ncbi:MAG: hypothetical protein WCH34_07190 [Bacteroidota bacterium]
MLTFLKKNFLWILLFGSLVGLNESFIGSFHLPYRSIVLSTISISLLVAARMKFPQKGTSFLIVLIALLFKINSGGFDNCTSSAFLCGHTALLSIGVAFEIFASLLIRASSNKYVAYLLTCALSSLLAFTMFAIFQTYILNAWDSVHLLEYIFIKSSFTALFSCIFALIFLALSSLKIRIAIKPLLMNSFLGVLIVCLWIVGYYTA